MSICAQKRNNTCVNYNPRNLLSRRKRDIKSKESIRLMAQKRAYKKLEVSFWFDLFGQKLLKKLRPVEVLFP